MEEARDVSEEEIMRDVVDVWREALIGHDREFKAFLLHMLIRGRKLKGICKATRIKIRRR